MSILELEPTIIILDTEYTAWEGSAERDWSGPNEYKEIIEIGAVKVETKNFQELEALQCFVKPRKNPELSDYIKKFTGISQADIDKEGKDLLEAFEKLSVFAHGANFHLSAEFPRVSAGMNAESGEGGRGNGSFPVAESSESSSVENRGVFKINPDRPIPHRSTSETDGLDLFSWGNDGEVVQANFDLYKEKNPIDFARFHDVRPLFNKHGIETKNFMSSTIIKAFGLEPSRPSHRALNDARTILDGLRELQKLIQIS